MAAGWVTALVLAAGGCTAAPSTQVPYPVGILYGVEPAAALGSDDLQRCMERDFASLRKLGFDTVFIQHAEDRDRRRIVEAAARHDLAVGLPSRDVVYYVRTGRLPQGCSSVEALAASLPRADGQSSTLAVLGEVTDEATGARIRRIGEARRARAADAVTFALVSAPGIEASKLRREVSLLGRTPEMAGADSAGDVMILQCVDSKYESPARSGSNWLAKYHAGLAAGLTGGLVLDRFRVVPGQWRALVEGKEPPNVQRSAAVRRISSRAKSWGAKLRRSRPQVIDPLGPASARLKVALFAGAKRRFVLVHNTSTGAFIHQPVSLPVVLAAEPVTRAVLVPPEAHVIAGEVVRPRGDRLTLPLDLAPGDACLWEIF
jgi:hypothetical protein